MKSSKHSVIVVGSGIAGLVSAAKLAENKKTLFAWG